MKMNGGVKWQVSLQGVLAARRLISRHLNPTPLSHYPLVSRWLGCEAYIKHENHNPTGSFKIRGGLNLIGNLTREERERGVITATRGNHGQSIALASRIHGVRCLIAVPEGNNPEKNEAIKSFGAELLVHGRDFDEAREKVEEICLSERLRYIHSANEPLLIEGVGTYALEIVEELPDLDYVFVPIGGGSGVCGLLTVIRKLLPSVRIVGVQAENASALYQSWKAGRPVTTESADTFADGLATRTTFELTFQLIQEQIDQVITVSEGELEETVYELLKRTHNIAEGAGAAATAGAYKMRAEIAGKKVVTILSGSNLETARLLGILERRS